jgi:hypothetical protein
MSNKRAYGSTTPWTAKDYHWFCECVDPWVDDIGECLACHRKPWVLTESGIVRHAD